MEAENACSKRQSWFCTTGLPTDVVIEVGEMSFHLHKFPLMNKSKKLHNLITEKEQKPSKLGDDNEEEEEGEIKQEEEEEEEKDFPLICLPDFPGGVEIFEVAAKFCYGVKIEMKPSNAVPLRCAAEYLEMTEEFAEENLVAKTKRYIAQSVLRNLKDSLIALKSCEDLLPFAEDLGIVQRCIDSIAARAAAASADLGSLFGWPLPDGSENVKVSHHSAVALWNGIEAGTRRETGTRSSAAGSTGADSGSWFEDLAALRLPIYTRVISSMKARDLSPEVIEGSLISYAKRSIPGLSRSNRHLNTAAASAVSPPSEAEQLEILETVVANLPTPQRKQYRQQRSVGGAVNTRLLFGLLRTANILRASDASRTALEKRIASQLHFVTLDDLLMPSYSYLVETLYDVDCVERIIGYFVESLGGGSSPSGDNGDSDNSKLLAVGKLIDGYLGEIASDANLKPEKFCYLALGLPDHARVFDDGLYRAVDIYLRAHPKMTEEEKEKVSGAMDCQKLTLEACTHAAQNERLPLRAVVQVLFFEQLQLRQAIAGTLMDAEKAAKEDEEKELIEDESWRRNRTEGGWGTAVRENQVLRLDMDSMRSRVQGLERECSTMRKVLERMDRGAGGGGWGSLSRRFGCKLSTQVRGLPQQRRVMRKSRIEYSP